MSRSAVNRRKKSYPTYVGQLLDSVKFVVLLQETLAIGSACCSSLILNAIGDSGLGIDRL